MRAPSPPSPVWIGTLSALALWWRDRDRTVAALALVATAWTLPTVIGTALGYPAVPRYLFEPVAICCVLAGIGLVALVRLARDPRVRAAVAVTLAVASAPFVVTRATGLGRQAAWAEGWADQASALWRAVDRAERHAPVARLHPVVEPGSMANGLAWKLSVHLDEVAGSFTHGARIAFLAGNLRAVIARLHRRDATAVPLTRAGPWHVVLVHWPRGQEALTPRPRRPGVAQRPARPPPPCSWRLGIGNLTASVLVTEWPPLGPGARSSEACVTSRATSACTAASSSRAATPNGSMCARSVKRSRWW